MPYHFELFQQRIETAQPFAGTRVLTVSLGDSSHQPTSADGATERVVNRLREKQLPVLLFVGVGAAYVEQSVRLARLVLEEIEAYEPLLRNLTLAFKFEAGEPYDIELLVQQLAKLEPFVASVYVVVHQQLEGGKRLLRALCGIDWLPTDHVYVVVDDLSRATSHLVPVLTDRVPAENVLLTPEMEFDDHNRLHRQRFARSYAYAVEVANQHRCGLNVDIELLT